MEAKFQTLVSQFVPIVVNFTSFGQRISPLGKDKIHYPNITINTAVNLIGAKARGSFQITHGSDNDYLNLDNSLVISIQFLSFTLNLGTYNWLNTNSLTAKSIATQISLLFPPYITTSYNKNSVVIEVDYSWFLTTYGHNINNCTLSVVTNGNVTVADVVNFENGSPTFLAPGAPTIGIAYIAALYPIGEPYMYSYFASEFQKETYIYFESEHKSETYIYYQSEENITPY